MVEGVIYVPLEQRTREKLELVDLARQVSTYSPEDISFFSSGRIHTAALEVSQRQWSHIYEGWKPRLEVAIRKGQYEKIKNMAKKKDIPISLIEVKYRFANPKEWLEFFYQAHRRPDVQSPETVQTSKRPRAVRLRQKTSNSLPDFTVESGLAYVSETSKRDAFEARREDFSF